MLITQFLGGGAGHWGQAKDDKTTDALVQLPTSQSDQKLRRSKCARLLIANGSGSDACIVLQATPSCITLRSVPPGRKAKSKDGGAQDLQKRRGREAEPLFKTVPHKNKSALLNAQTRAHVTT